MNDDSSKITKIINGFNDYLNAHDIDEDDEENTESEE